MTQHPGPPASATPSRRTTAAPITVTAVVIARTREGTGQVLAALLAQDTAPDRVLLVDASADGIGDPGDLLSPVDDAGIDVLRATLAPRQGLRRHLPRFVDAIPRARLGRDLIWVLTSRARPHPEALHRLAAACVPGVGMAVPELVDADHPDHVVRLGLQATRTGRLVPDPLAGTVDEGQLEGRVDTLGAPLEGLLLDRETFETLRGHDPSLGDLGGDLDLGWRSHRAGRRAVLVPSAAVAVPPTAAERHPTSSQRRQARRAALTRANLLLAPFLALWILLASVVTGLGLLLIKRPRMALEELGDAGAALDPRLLRSRVRRNAPRKVPRRHLRNLFVTPGRARRRLVDEVRGPTLRTAAPPPERGPRPTGPARVLHPLPLLVLAAVAMTAWAARHLAPAVWDHRGSGLVGGELLGGRATSGQLWDAWWMAWHGEGWGSGSEISPAYLLLAAASRVLEWLPGSPSSPAGAVVTGFVLVALPLAAVVAWVSAGTFTSRPWLRAAAALAWVGSAPAALAVGEGRIGALVALVLLPRIAAGLVRLGRAGMRPSDSVRTAVWAGVLATFAPVVGVAVVLVGLGHLVFGGTRRRPAGLALVLVPPLLAGPWLLTLRAEPRRLLTGWGLTDTQVTTEPWCLALGELPGAAPTTWWWTAGILVLGLLALLVPGRRRATWAAAVTALLGLCGAVGAPHLGLTTRPEGAADAGDLVTPWAGTGQLALVGAALVAILLAADVLPDAVRGSGRRGWLWLPALVLPVLAVGSALVVAQHSFGERLAPWEEPRLASAIAAAEGPRAARTLVIAPGEGQVRYRVVGSEPGPVARDLRTPRAPTPGEEQVVDAVARLLGSGEGDRPTSDVLAEQAVSHVVLVGGSEAQRRAVGATEGLAPVDRADGRTTWAVRASLTDGKPPSRARVVQDGRSVALRGTGAHADTDGPVAAGGGELVVGQSVAWAEVTSVRADGDLVRMSTHSQTPTYELPAGTERVSIDVSAGHRVWKIATGIALLLVLYLALPTDRRPVPRPEEER